MDELTSQLVDYRKALGMTQAEVGTAMGMTQGNIARAERHGIKTMDFLRKYMDVLGVGLKLAPRGFIGGNTPAEVRVPTQTSVDEQQDYLEKALPPPKPQIVDAKLAKKLQSAVDGKGVSVKMCKNGHILSSNGKCLQKGCKYA